MKKVYTLPVARTGDTDTVAGIDLMHDATLTLDNDQATLIMDTTTDEDRQLSALASNVRAASIEEERQLADSQAFTPAVPARNLLDEVDQLRAELDALKARPVRKYPFS